MTKIEKIIPRASVSTDNQSDESVVAPKIKKKFNLKYIIPLVVLTLGIPASFLIYKSFAAGVVNINIAGKGYVTCKTSDGTTHTWTGAGGTGWSVGASGVSCKAYAGTGYEYDHWTDATGNNVQFSNPLWITVPTNTSWKVSFITNGQEGVLTNLIPTTSGDNNILATIGPVTGGGIVSGAGLGDCETTCTSFGYGSGEVQIWATPNNSTTKFLRWESLDTSVIYTDNPLKVNMSRGWKLRVVFSGGSPTPSAGDFTVTTTVTPVGGGHTSGAGLGNCTDTCESFGYGSGNAQIWATPANSKIKFLRWEADTGATYTQNPLSVTMARSWKIKAVFSAGVAPPVDTNLGAKVVSLARAQLNQGKTYILGSCHMPGTVNSPPSYGCSHYDCSGLAAWAWYWGTGKKFLPEGDTGEMYANRNNTARYTRLSHLSELKAGDLLVRRANGHGHVMIATGRGTVIEAYSSGHPIREVPYSHRDGTAYAIHDGGVWAYLRPVVK